MYWISAARTHTTAPHASGRKGGDFDFLPRLYVQYVCMHKPDLPQSLQTYIHSHTHLSYTRVATESLRWSSGCESGVSRRAIYHLSGRVCPTPATFGIQNSAVFFLSYSCSCIFCILLVSKQYFAFWQIVIVCAISWATNRKYSCCICHLPNVLLTEVFIQCLSILTTSVICLCSQTLFVCLRAVEEWGHDTQDHR